MTTDTIATTYEPCYKPGKGKFANLPYAWGILLQDGTASQGGASATEVNAIKAAKDLARRVGLDEKPYTDETGRVWIGMWVAPKGGAPRRI